MALSKPLWLGQLLSYGGIGVINTLAGVGTIFLAVSCGLGTYESNVIGYAVGFLISFYLNRTYTFRQHAVKKWSLQFKRYILNFFGGYICNISIIFFLQIFYPEWRYLNQFLGWLAFFTIGFLGSKYYVYRHH